MEALIIFFIKYLLAPILATVFLVVIGNLIKLKSDALKMKKVILLIIVVSLILVLPCLFGFLKNEYIWGGLVLTIITYLTLGVCFIYVRNLGFYKNIKGQEPEQNEGDKKRNKLDVNKIIELLIIFVAIILSTWGFYLLFDFISELPYSSWAMFSTVWFIIPYLFLISKELFLKVETPFYKAWSVEDSDEHEEYWDNIDTFRLIQVTVKIKRKSSDENYASFSVKLPKEVPLGVWFNKFINDQNVRFPENMIDPVGKEGKQIGWIFYTGRWLRVPLFIKILNSEKDGEFNKIKNKQIVYIRRTKVK